MTMRMGLNLLLLAFLAIFIVACAPEITVQNKTAFGTRAMICPHGQPCQVVSPSPGESSSVEAATGAYVAIVIPSQEWMDYAKGVREYLLGRLANFNNLSGAELRDVGDRLKDIARRMDQYQKTGEKGSSCDGTLTQEKDGVVTVSTGPGGELVVVCY